MPPRYFLLVYRENMGKARFWTYVDGEDFVTVFDKNGRKRRVMGYKTEEVDLFVSNETWEEITEAEAALL